MKKLEVLLFAFSALLLGNSCKQPSDGNLNEKSAVDYVNPLIGTISHLLVPTFPTIHLPNSILRVYPERSDFTGNQLFGLPIIMTSHRGSSAFNLSIAKTGENESPGSPVVSYSYDNEIIKPYYYAVYLDELGAEVKFAPSHQSAIYEITLNDKEDFRLLLHSKNGALKFEGNAVSGYQQIGQSNTNVYIYLETNSTPTEKSVLGGSGLNAAVASGKNACVVLNFDKSAAQLKVRYGISFISTEQARKNLYREIFDYNLEKVALDGRKIWNDKLSKIKVSGTDEKDKTLFYTALYRTYERMICISEDGQYYSAFDEKIHKDNGKPFYTDDWIWDTYRAVHPLRVIIEPEMETNMINSYLRMAEQMPDFWMPTFPEVTGDSRRMNSNHGVATVIDAYNKGLRGFDLAKAYQACKGAITEKTLAPWSGQKAGKLDAFYKTNGYIPALAEGEKETIPEVHSFERRQPVAVTLGTVYDEWCLAQIAKQLNLKEDYAYFLNRSLNYRKIFNAQTLFFHPRDAKGRFLSPFSYEYSGGIGARNAYGENNGWIYRWDVPHNVADLIKLNGGNEKFVSELERMYNTPLGKSKYEFYSQLPDHTGNVGQFSMANEPSMHIPYLYNYAGQPWRTQKRVRSLMDQWFRNDLMGMPGDEDGGGMSAFVVFSMMGFYPVTPGLPIYVIGTPFFEKVEIELSNHKIFEVYCENYGKENKYIQSATLNGKDWNKSWFTHDELMQGGKLTFVMGAKANRQWASSPASVPPSYTMEK